MKEKIIRNRKYILLTLAILILVVFNIGMRYLVTRPRYKTLPEVRLVNQKEENTKGYAIMVQNGDIYEEYTSEDGTWPSEGYEFKEAKCIDNEGQLVEGALTFKDGKATLTTSQTVYCTMYFDKVTTIGVLREKDTQGYLSDDEQGGMYRYQAAPSSSSDATNMTNWICFGTKDQSACKNDIDKYMYRIIGITEDGQMYLIKETFLKEGSNTVFAWNTAYIINSGSGVWYCSGGVCPEWNEADLFKRINGTANGTKSGSGDANDGVDNDTDIFVDSSQYDYLKSEDNIVDGKPQPSEWYNLIEKHEWMYGDTVDTSSNIYNGDYMYKIETGDKNTTTKHYIGKYGSVKEDTYYWPETNKVKAKISLMYLHDVDYAYPAGIPGSYTNVANSWIHFRKDGYNTEQSYEWLSTRWGVYSSRTDSVCTWTVDSGGNLDGGSGLYDPYGVRPVFYLSSKAKIVDGDGTKDDPYTLG